MERIRKAMEEMASNAIEISKSLSDHIFMQPFGTKVVKLEIKSLRGGEE